jgi:hypothetical protein
MSAFCLALTGSCTRRVKVSKAIDREVQAYPRMDIEPSDEAARLLQTVENHLLDRNTRAAAVRRLAEMREAATIWRLIKLLPGDYDTVTLEIIIALGEFGDSRVVPVLEAVRVDAANEGIEIPGQINASISLAIKACRARIGKDVPLKVNGRFGCLFPWLWWWH